ncbi:MAG: ATP-dependent Clp protease proteolytic subunit, partial [Chloroflexi bacterium]|nr:ATP-dependent Clp protease proteolytic subunit [Chloroflexota bacterium]
REILRNNETIRNILAKHTGQPVDVIKRDTDRDFYLDAEQAQEYGLVDEVLQAQQREPVQAAS